MPDFDPVGGSRSWYLDRLSALEKRRCHLELFRRWTRDFRPRMVLKTDLFEEANGSDQLLFDLDLGQAYSLGMDVVPETVRRANERSWNPGARLFAGDARQLGLASNSVDLIISTSTLDHFRSREEFDLSVGELARVLAPGGRLLLTIDNPWNPMYYPLRWICSLPGAPFELGYTPARRRLGRLLEEAGLSVDAWAPVIHNPTRILSSAAFLGLRRLLGERAERPIAATLKMYRGLDSLPTRWLTCCFIGVRAVKR